MCSAKEKRILFLSWSTLHILISKCIVSVDSTFFYFDFPQFTIVPWIYQKCMYKGHLFLNFACSTKEVVLLPLSRSTLYIAVRKYIVSLFYFFYFLLPRFTQNTSAKVIFSWNSRRSAKEAVILLLSWSALSIAFSKCI